LLFWRRREAQLSEEIRTHLDLLTDEFVAQGLAPAAARTAARREFGGIEATKDAARDERAFPFLESLIRDAVFAVRQLRRRPSFTLTAMLTLALGIGGTTAMFSVLDLVAIRPLPYPDPHRLVTLQETLPTFGPFRSAPQTPLSGASTRRRSTTSRSSAASRPT
jgi:hypothetical protein